MVIPLKRSVYEVLRLMKQTECAILFPIRGWSEKFSSSNIAGNNIGRISFPKLVHLS